MSTKGTIFSTVAVVGVAAAVTVAAIAASHVFRSSPNPATVPGSVEWHQHHPVHTPPLPTGPLFYLGVYEPDSPASYADTNQFAAAAGIVPDIALYYSGWWVPFKSSFAEDALASGAVPAVQIDPNIVSLARIAAGKYDAYLRSFADEVATYGHPVIIGFGHEMNGSWYPWGHRHTSPKVFVAAWRHVVTVFRQQGADNVTWLWTVNIIDLSGNLIPSPGPWWPGAAYVTWIGIDGYYREPFWKFDSLFGPTIKAVRALTPSPIPILISETAATPSSEQPANIANLFAGINGYGLLGFVWFNAKGKEDWRLTTDSIRAFHHAATAYKRPVI
jgi:hypothetical protein